MYETFKFNGITKDWLYIEEGRKNPPFPALKRNLIEIPGYHGALLQSTDIEPRVIEQPFGFKIKNEEWPLIKDELASWLFTSEPAPLELPDEPGRVYYALVQDSIDDFERVSRTRLRKGTITFLCLDPYAYGEERIFDISNNVIPNEGTAETYPVFDLTVKQETTLLSIGNMSNQNEDGDPYTIYLGTEVDVDEDVQEDRTLVLHDTMQSTSGWTGASNVDNGRVTGQMGVMDDGFYVESWGDENEEGMSGEWIGPSLQREFDEELNSFIADIDISNVNVMDDGGRSVGIIEVYLRDINDEKICKFQFGDTTDVEALNKGVFATPEKSFIIRPTSNPKGFNNFNGQLRIERDSGYYYPKLTKIKNGIRMKWFPTNPKQIIPVVYGTNSSAENPVKKIQIALRKWVGAKRITMRIKEIKVWSIRGMYEYPDKKTVHKFKPGDQVHIDTRPESGGLVLVNGEERTDLIRFGNDMFTLVEGLNYLDVDNETLEGTVTYRNRYF